MECGSRAARLPNPRDRVTESTRHVAIAPPVVSLLSLARSQRSVRDWQADAEMSLSLRLAGEWDSSLSRIPDACVCTALRTLTRFVTRPMARWLAGCGITRRPSRARWRAYESGRW